MKLPILLLLLFMSLISNAQGYKKIDLAVENHNESTIDIETLGIQLINKLPFKDYLISVEVSEERSGTPLNQLAGADECLELQTKYKNVRTKLINEKEEKNIEIDIKALKDTLDNIADADCKEVLKKDFADLEAATIDKPYNFGFKLKKNQNIIVTIKRSKPSAKSWTIVFRTPRTVNYITHFGLTFVPNGEDVSKNFYCKADTGSTYLIKKMNKNGKDFWKDLSLTANFIVYPFKVKNDNANIKIGWVAGFGISGDAKFTVFTGPSVVFSDFISLSVGPGLYNCTRLKGEYSPDQRINENLNFDQLHEKGLRPNVIISLGFRLSKEQLQEAIESIGGTP